MRLYTGRSGEKRGKAAAEFGDRLQARPGASVKRPITGFGIDKEGDWFAYLICGHRQHVRHQPPFIDRPWVTTRAGRNSRMGWPLNCVRCDRLEWPDNAVLQDSTDTLTEQALVQASSASHVEAGDVWVRIVVTRGVLRYRSEALGVDMQLTPDSPGVVPPQAAHELEADGSAAFKLESWRAPEAPSDVTDERMND